MVCTSEQDFRLVFCYDRDHVWVTGIRLHLTTSGAKYNCSVNNIPL